MTAKIEIWDIYTKNCLAIFDSGHTHRINSMVTFFDSEQGNLLLTAGSNAADNHIKIWNVEKGYMVGLDLLENNVIENGFIKLDKFNDQGMNRGF